MVKDRNLLVIDSLRHFNGECRFQELFNYINDIDYQCKMYQQQRGLVQKNMTIDRDGDVVRLVE